MARMMIFVSIDKTDAERVTVEALRARLDEVFVDGEPITSMRVLDFECDDEDFGTDVDPTSPPFIVGLEVLRLAMQETTQTEWHDAFTWSGLSRDTATWCGALMTTLPDGRALYLTDLDDPMTVSRERFVTVNGWCVSVYASEDAAANGDEPVTQWTTNTKGAPALVRENLQH